MDAHAQKEIRDYAVCIGERILAPLFPVVWEAFIDYRVQSLELTRLEIGVLTRLMTAARTAGKTPPLDEPLFLEVQDEAWRPLTRSRERDECREKLRRLGVLQP